MSGKTITRISLHRISTLLVLLSVFGTLAQNQEFCEFHFTVCPRNFDGDTIQVPEKVIAMAPRIHTCEGWMNEEPSDTVPPSIMFVIDNSGSMSGLGSDPNDRMGSRFTVSLALLDEIYRHTPDARVGFAVLQNILYFDHRDDPFFTQLPGDIDNVTHQSYIPLTRLDSVFSDGTKGIEKLKQVMAIDTTRGRLHDGTIDDYVHLQYVPEDTSNHSLYTNINVGFMAAKHAFQSTSIATDKQHIVFFSDGEPAGDMQAGLPRFHFRDGDSVPTTYTVFFTKDNQAPSSLQTMTENIQKNGYSSSNPSSNLWTIESSHDALLALVLENIMGTIFYSKPNAMSITGVTISDTSTTYVDSYFVFSDPVPLQPDITPFTIDFAFQTIDQNTGDSRDTIVNVSLWVQRDSATPSQAPPGLAYTCWPRPTLGLSYHGEPISEVNDFMKQLEVSFHPGDPRLTSVKTDLSSKIDSGSVDLHQSGARWTAVFNRQTGGPATTGDDLLVHSGQDSIVVVYRNPRLPLDTARLAVPVRIDTTIIPVTATLRDTSRDGHLDRIDLSWASSTPVRTTMPPVDSLVKQLKLTRSDGSPIDLSAFSIEADVDEQSISLILKENSGPVLETEWQDAQILLGDVPMGDDGEPMVVTRIIDGAGPVIQRVDHRGKTETTGQDSLLVTFSEPVDCSTLTSLPPESAFVYYRKEGEQTDALENSSFAGACQSSFVRQVTIVLPSTDDIAAWEDRLGPGPRSSLIADSAGNSMTSSPAVVVRGKQTETIEVTVSQNPASPKNKIDSRIRSTYASAVGDRTHGVVIGVYSRMPLQTTRGPDGTLRYGTADIYDAVGNLVEEDLPLRAASEAGVYGAYWSIRNRHERLVGNGTYLAIVKTTPKGSQEKRTRIKIGVRR